MRPILESYFKLCVQIMLCTEGCTRLSLTLGRQSEASQLVLPVSGMSLVLVSLFVLAMTHNKAYLTLYVVILAACKLKYVFIYPHSCFLPCCLQRVPQGDLHHFESTKI